MKKKMKLSQLLFGTFAVLIASSLFLLGLFSLQVIWKVTEKKIRNNAEQVAYAARTMVDNRMNLYTCNY